MAFKSLFHRQITLPRWARAGLVVLAVGVAILAWKLTEPTDEDKQAPGADGWNQPELGAGGTALRVHKPSPVPVNRTADVLDGFRGDRHPLLHGRTRLEVTAHWAPLDRRRLKLDPAPEVVYSWYTGLRPAAAQTTYTERDFSAFLPEAVTDVGQLWAIDPDKVKAFLRQFHASAAMHLVATGRRAGPDGAFATLRAVSPSHLDIRFRVHAEFLVTPLDNPGPLVFAWYTPAYFSGRILVNKTTGTVEHFRLALPTEKALNVFLTANPSMLGIPALGHDIVRVERMELSGGDEGLVDRMSWARSLPLAEADRRLARVFYKFEEIDWAPLDQVLAQARDKKRPICAVVSWGATDDQSC